MKIEINKLVKIVFDVKDFDEHLPSVQFEVRIDVQKFAYNLCTESSFWFECRIFDEFIKDMQKNQCAVLKDINESFEIIIDPHKETLQWLMRKEDLEGNVSVAQGAEKLMADMRGVICHLFMAYPKWW